MIFYDLSFKLPHKKKISNKATGIAWLIDNGYRTPDGIYIHFHKSSYSFKKLKKGLDKLKGRIRKISNNSSFVVRSAHPQEDALTESMAGKFRTIPNIGLEEIISAIDEVVVHSFKIFPKYPETGIIIQPQIKSKYAGILFTSNPITGLIKEGLVSITTGAGPHLVSGQITGNTYYVDDSVKLISGNHEIPKFILNKFPSYIKSLRNKYDYPADLEWVIDNDNQIWFLQIRPITGIGPDKNRLLKIGDQYKNGGDNEKNNIRYFAKRFDLKASQGWEVSLSTYSDQNDIMNLFADLHIDSLLSIVLTEPSLIQRKIYRKFCSKTNLLNRVYELINKFKSEYLKIKCTLLEIINPVFSGIIKMEKSNFIIELAKGHYIAKGITPLSNYLLDKDYKVQDKNEVVQDEFYILFETGPKKIKERQKNSFSSNQLKKIARSLKPLLEEFPCVLEFGIMANHDLILMGYTKEACRNDYIEFQSGIISPGIIKGVVIYPETSQLLKKSVDMHMLDFISITNENSRKGKFIIFAERPSLMLQIFIEEFGVGNIGFLFKELSLLNHFSIRLRELNIPALWWDSDITKYLNKEVVLDAQSAVLDKIKRIKEVKQND